jgi:hypothetical protein
MPGTMTPKKKKKKSSGFPFLTPKQKKMLDQQTGKSKPIEASIGARIKPMKKKTPMYKAYGGKIGDGNYKSCGANIMRTK